MSIAMAVELKHLRQEVEALVSLVRTLAAEVDVLKQTKNEMQAPPRRGRPPKETYEQH